jgi:hypothetical protein
MSWKHKLRRLSEPDKHVLVPICNTYHRLYIIIAAPGRPRIQPNQRDRWSCNPWVQSDARGPDADLWMIKLRGSAGRRTGGSGK